MIELLLTLIGEFLIQILAELAIELGLGSVVHSLRGERKANKVLAMIGIAIFGAVVGLIFSLVFPSRILPPPTIPGISLIAAPVMAGLVMRAFGDWRRKRGHDTSLLATFWGGALFAFALAATRWWMVGSLG